MDCHKRTARINLNIHVTDELREKQPSWEFMGIPWDTPKGHWIKARHKTVGWTWFYWFEKDIFIDNLWYDMEHREYEKKTRP